jgi:hypothetical protein
MNKKHMKTIIYLLLISMNLGCKSPSFYNRLTSIDKANLKRDHLDQVVFDMLQDSLIGSDHLIYIYNHINHLPIVGTKDFDALVYDYRQNKTFYIRNKDLKSLDIKLEKYKSDFNMINSILKYYLADKISYLKSFENTDISEGGLWITYLYDIDLKQNQIKKYTLESMTFDKTGAPVSFNDFMKGLKE